MAASGITKRSDGAICINSLRLNMGATCLSQLADAVCTYIGLEKGFSEGNPIWNYFYQSGGHLSLQGGQLALTAGIIGYALYQRNKKTSLSRWMLMGNTVGHAVGALSWSVIL